MLEHFYRLRSFDRDRPRPHPDTGYGRPVSIAVRPGILSSAFDEAVIARIADAPPLSPYPPAEAPDWRRLDALTRAEILAGAAEAMSGPWPVLTLSQRLELTRSGSRERFETPYFSRRRRLVAIALALAVEPADELADAFLDGLWSVLEETSWCVPAHETPAGGTGVRALPVPGHPVLDLFAAETGAMLAWMLVTHGERIDAIDGLRSRIVGAIDERVLTPFADDAREYHWFALPSNWNPWVVSNVMACAFLTPPTPPRLGRVLGLAIESLDAYLATVPQDGGCPEGIGYWWQSAARLFEGIELLAHADGEAGRAVLEEPLLRRLARYPLVVHLGGEWSAVFGDGTARMPVAGSRLGRDRHPAALLWRFARAVDDPELARFARRMRGDGPRVDLPVSMSRALGALFAPEWDTQGADAEPLWPGPETRWLDEIEVFSATAGSTLGDLRLVAKGGTNGEPHNHLDVGSFVLARDGEPIVIDVGMGRYTASSFTAARYEQWFTDSAYHSVPEVDGIGQLPGEQYRARLAELRAEGDDWMLCLDLAAAYPVEAGVSAWERTFERQRDCIVLTERWTLARRRTTLISRLILARPPVVERAGRVLLFGADDRAGTAPLAVLEFDPARAAWRAEEHRLDDSLLSSVWGESVHRAELLVSAPESEGELSLRFSPYVDRF